MFFSIYPKKSSCSLSIQKNHHLNNRTPEQPSLILPQVSITTSRPAPSPLDHTQLLEMHARARRRQSTDRRRTRPLLSRKRRPDASPLVLSRGQDHQQWPAAVITGGTRGRSRAPTGGRNTGRARVSTGGGGAPLALIRLHISSYR
jgi:hypothetical protein